MLSPDSYANARRALERSKLGRDPTKLGMAYKLAVQHCERARKYGWPEFRVRKRGREAVASWPSANAAARKLAVHFESLDDLTATLRLIHALDPVGLSMTVRRGNTLAWAFPALLRALAKQTPRKGGRSGGYVVGPLKVGKSSRKWPGRNVVLTLVLAYLFDRVFRHDKATGPLELYADDAITSGAAWEAAACFADAALGGMVDCVAAKKFLRDHRGHLYLRSWPKGRVVTIRQKDSRLQ